MDPLPEQAQAGCPTAGLFVQSSGDGGIQILLRVQN